MINALLFVITSLLIIPFSSMQTSSVIPPCNTTTYHIFILAGQSNMAGRGGVNGPWDGIVPPECLPDPLKVFRLNAALDWEVAVEPIHNGIERPDKTNGIGPGMAFANAIKGSTNKNTSIGLVPCAIGGSKIENWTRGNPMYETMIRRAKVAALSGQIKAVLWYQGESDTGVQDVEAYGQNMANLVLNVRTDLNLPWLPVIQVAIASAGFNATQASVDALRAVQKGLQLPNVACVDAKGLELNTDRLHLSTSAQVIMGGHLLAEAYFDFIRPQFPN